jgi:hypothetical protein
VQTFDAVVIGAGPAGLSAAAELSGEGSCLLLDEGPVAGRRRREAPGDLLSGVGGAGLFSDGKYSFFPAATELWALPDKQALGYAFARTADLLRRAGVEAGALPSAPPSAAIEPGSWQEKRYPSIYVPFAARLDCIESLWAASGERRAEARVVGAARVGAGFELQIEQAGQPAAVRARALVIATGRWSPRWVRPWLGPLGVKFAFRRVEYGVRLETDAGHPLFSRLTGVDSKLRFAEPGPDAIEARTFCTCRGGEVVLGRSRGLQAFSGRADGPPTGRSNLGLLVRSGREPFGREVERFLDGATPSSFPLSDWLDRGPDRLAPLFGPPGAAALWRALLRLIEHCPPLRDPGTIVHAPCIEGVGDYPVDDGSLQLAPGIWIAGDAGGRFRGIVASLVSGRYAARRLTRGGR